MATFALIHGAGDVGWYWHLVEPELQARGHDTVAPDLPVDAESLEDYADAVVRAVGERDDVVVVAQSLGGFTAPLVAERLDARLIVMVAAMMPRPGETFGDWWQNTGYPGGGGDYGDDDIATFLHDVPRELAVEALERGGEQAEGPLEQPWPMDGWPDVPTRFVLCRNDRVFPADWMRAVVRERLAIEPDEIDAAHTPALSRPVELAELLDSYLR